MTEGEIRLLKYQALTKAAEWYFDQLRGRGHNPRLYEDDWLFTIIEPLVPVIMPNPLPKDEEKP